MIVIGIHTAFSGISWIIFASAAACAACHFWIEIGVRVCRAELGVLFVVFASQVISICDALVPVVALGNHGTSFTKGLNAVNGYHTAAGVEIGITGASTTTACTADFVCFVILSIESCTLAGRVFITSSDMIITLAITAIFCAGEIGIPAILTAVGIEIPA